MSDDPCVLPRPLRGIIVPMVTPLVDRDTIDVAGLERLIEHVLSAGVHGLFVLGSTGEAPSLGYRLRRDFVHRTCAAVRGRVPVLVGITDTAFVESVRMARVAADAGAAALVLAPPYYFPAGQAELLEYLGHLVKELPLPLFLYNMPAYTKLPYELETVRRAAELPRVAGIKDSSGSLVYLRGLVSHFGGRPEFALLTGPEELLAESIRLGAHGGVNGGANLHPRLYLDLYEAARSGDLDRVAQLQGEVEQIRAGIYGVGRFGSSYLKGLKCALSLLGICSDFMAEPFHRFNPPERARVEQELRRLGLVAK